MNANSIKLISLVGPSKKKRWQNKQRNKNNTNIFTHPFIPHCCHVNILWQVTTLTLELSMISGARYQRVATYSVKKPV